MLHCDQCAQPVKHDRNELAWVTFDGDYECAPDPRTKNERGHYVDGYSSETGDLDEGDPLDAA